MRFSGGCVAEVATMEVPQPVVIPVDYTGSLGEEGDDVLPSPTPAPASPGVTSGLFFQRGFLDCAQAALTFLTEVEGIPEDSPVVDGLKQHLIHVTEQFTPASVASPSAPCIFTFPPVSSVDDRVMRTKHIYNISQPRTTVVGPDTSMSVRRENNRVVPYRVTSHRSGGVLNRQPRGDLEKHSSVSMTTSQDSFLQSTTVHRLTQASSTTSSTKSLENVLQSEQLISTDNLRGVLRCLQVIPTAHEFSHHHPSTHCSTPSSCYMSVNAPVAGQVNAVGNSLDDSGISADLTDEVDGNDCTTDSVLNDVSHSCRAVAPAVSGCVQEVMDSVYTDSANYSELENFEASNHQNHAIEPSYESSLNVPSPLRPAHLSSSSVTTSSITSSLVSSTTVSSPSSQLSLLSSLSSGSHRLTSQSLEGSATANRIQSLANEILLLLEEEAEADDESVHGESSESEDEESDESYDEDSDEDDSAVEMEP